MQNITSQSKIVSDGNNKYAAATTVLSNSHLAAFLKHEFDFRTCRRFSVQLNELKACVTIIL